MSLNNSMHHMERRKISQQNHDEANLFIFLSINCHLPSDDDYEEKFFINLCVNVCGGADGDRIARLMMSRK